MKKFVVLFLFFTSFEAFAQASWQEVFSGVSNHFKCVTFISPSTGYVFGEGLYLKTTNGGTNWQQNPMPYKMIDAYFTNELTGFVIGSSIQNDTNVVLKTTNGGSTWSKYYIELSLGLTKIKFVDNNTGYVFSRTSINQIRRTTNAGVSWLPFSIPGQNSYDIDASQNIIISGRYNAPNQYPKVMYSTDAGSNWSSYELSTSSYQNMACYIVHIFNNTTYSFCFGSYNGTSSNKMFNTTNSGNNWYNITPTPMTPFAFVHLKFLDEANWYDFNTSQNNSTLHRTTNRGTNWSSVVVNTPYVTDVYFANSLTGYAVADYGVVLKTTNGGIPIGIHTISNSIPADFKLSQNYPNPFNPSTIIEFQIPTKEFIQLEIFNSTGAVVQQLVSQELQPGTYKYDFNGDNLPSGIFYYRLTAGTNISTMKMILLK